MEEFLNSLKYDEKGLIPVIARETETREILMLAYANREALTLTIETAKAHYFSRSRNDLWFKGETSGNYQYISSIQIDCDGDALIYNVRQTNGACHTGSFSCFYREFKYGEGTKELSSAKQKPDVSSIGIELDTIYRTIKDRKENPVKGAYTTYLFESGLDKILKKVGEEASEVIIGSKNNSKPELIYESSDLLYHLMVLLVEQGVSLHEIQNELYKRKK